MTTTPTRAVKAAKASITTAPLRFRKSLSGLVLGPRERGIILVTYASRKPPPLWCPSGWLVVTHHARGDCTGWSIGPPTDAAIGAFTFAASDGFLLKSTRLARSRALDRYVEFLAGQEHPSLWRGILYLPRRGVASTLL